VHQYSAAPGIPPRTNPLLLEGAAALYQLMNDVGKIMEVEEQKKKKKLLYMVVGGKNQSANARFSLKHLPINANQ